MRLLLRHSTTVRVCPASLDNPVGLKHALSDRDDGHSADEECSQRGNEHLIRRAMILTFQGATLRVGKHVGKLVGPMAHERVGFFTTHDHGAVHHQRGTATEAHVLSGAGLPLSRAPLSKGDRLHL